MYYTHTFTVYSHVYVCTYAFIYGAQKLTMDVFLHHSLLHLFFSKQGHWINQELIYSAMPACQWASKICLSLCPEGWGCRWSLSPWSCPHLKNSHLDNWIISPALNIEEFYALQKKKWRMNRAENREREGAHHGRLHCRPLSLKHAELGKGVELPRWYNVITLNYFNRNTKAFGHVTGMVKSYWTRRTRLLSSCN